MSNPPIRPDLRFTDQEVALVLKKAAEIEERQDNSVAVGGLSIEDLQQLAREVGLDPATIDQAVAAVRLSKGPERGGMLGPPVSTKVVRAIPGDLPPEALQQLIQMVEEETEATGTVTEALGTVRWTSVGRDHRFDRSTQVSVTKTGRETQIQVAQRYPTRLRVLVQLLPASWGAMIGGAIAASSALNPLTGIGVGLGAAAVGLGLGRTLWQTLAKKNSRQTEQLSDSLARTASQLSNASDEEADPNEGAPMNRSPARKQGQ